MNEIAWNFFESFVTILEAAAVILLSCSFFDFDFRKIKSVLKYLSGAGLLSATIFIMDASADYEGIAGIIYSVIIFLYLIMAVKGSISKKIFISIFVNLFALASSVIASGIVSDLAGTEIQNLYSDKGVYRFATIVISKSILIAGVYALFKNNVSKKVDIKKPEWILAAAVFLITFVLFALIRSAKLMIEPSSKPQTFLSVAEYGLVLINIICVFVIRKLNVLNAVEKENIVLKQQSEFNQQSAEKTKSEERELTRIRHDFKQSIAVIKGLLSERNLDKLEDYLSEYEKSYTISDSRTYTKNEFVNSILNVKLYYAKRIGFETFCSMINYFGDINDVDLCNLIGNLLDNAIEGSLSTEAETKSVEINISNNGKNVVVRVENTIGNSVLNTNPNLNTSKKDSGKHGYGIKNIKNICKKYRGDFDYYENKGVFCCIAILRCDLGDV